MIETNKNDIKGQREASEMFNSIGPVLVSLEFDRSYTGAQIIDALTRAFQFKGRAFDKKALGNPETHGDAPRDNDAEALLVKCSDFPHSDVIIAADGSNFFLKLDGLYDSVTLIGADLKGEKRCSVRGF